MSAYEAMFIFQPGLGEQEQKTQVAGIENILKENQAKLLNSQVFGRRQLAYVLNKHKEGLYHLMDFSASSGAVVTKLKKACGINENILRVLIVKKEAKSG
ncbi:MAG: 30S ribosomal protein S6 [Candidatus Omnitrophota bacterium]|nr:MAG: 30S ribosomal protein S6 [Candidatus Omnitrophota bacterium]